ncbi:hypothetical protein ACFX16_032058 [Malus domestica]
MGWVNWVLGLLHFMCSAPAVELSLRDGEEEKEKEREREDEPTAPSSSVYGNSNPRKVKTMPSQPTEEQTLR